MVASDAGAQRRARLSAARLYLVCGPPCDGHGRAELPRWEALLRAAIAGGVEVVQLRAKELQERDLVRAGELGRALCHELGALFIVNDRPEVALGVGADGVHVGQQDMPVGEARRLLGPELLIGLSTHAPGEIDAASPTGATPADYIGVGPVFATPTKPGRPAVGLELVEYAAAHAALPFFAIGGIEAGNLAQLTAAGARRVAVVRAIAEADEPEAAARALVGELARRPAVRPAESVVAA